MDHKIEIKMPDAQLTKLNTRTEGNKKDPIPAEDMKLHGVTGAAFLFPLLGKDIPECPEGFKGEWDPVKTLPFWEPDGSLSFLGLSDFGSWCELKGASMSFGNPNAKAKDRVNVDGGVTVKGFKFKIIAGWNIELTLTAQARLDDKQATIMRHMQQKHGQLVITTDEAAVYSQDEDKTQDDLPGV
jgi:hypothetical protein